MSITITIIIIKNCFYFKPSSTQVICLKILGNIYLYAVSYTCSSTTVSAKCVHQTEVLFEAFTFLQCCVAVQSTLLIAVTENIQSGIPLTINESSNTTTPLVT